MDANKYFDGRVSCTTYIEQKQTPEIRLDKVLDVRCRLSSIEYSLAEHLDDIVDRLLEDILG